MTLLTRVKRLEGRVRIPFKPVIVVFKKNGELDGKMVRLKDAEVSSEDLVIFVEFIEPATGIRSNQ